jgi:hypothetical protein
VASVSVVIPRCDVNDEGGVGLVEHERDSMAAAEDGGVDARVKHAGKVGGWKLPERLYFDGGVVASPAGVDKDVKFATLLLLDPLEKLLHLQRGATDMGRSLGGNWWEFPSNLYEGSEGKKE